MSRLRRFAAWVFLPACAVSLGQDVLAAVAGTRGGARRAQGAAQQISSVSVVDDHTVEAPAYKRIFVTLVPGTAIQASFSTTWTYCGGGATRNAYAGLGELVSASGGESVWKVSLWITNNWAHGCWRLSQVSVQAEESFVQDIPHEESVTMSVSSDRAEVSPPNLASIEVIGSTTVRAPGSVTLSMHVTDESGVDASTFYFQWKHCTQAQVKTFTPSVGLISGSTTDGVWEAAFTVDNTWLRGCWQVQSLWIRDIYGELSTSAPGEASRIFVESTMMDLGGPQIHSLAVSGEYNVSIGATVVVRVDVSDQGAVRGDSFHTVWRTCGGSYASATKRNLDVVGSLASGTTSAGIWNVYVPIASDWEFGCWRLTFMHVLDEHGQRGTYSYSSMEQEEAPRIIVRSSTTSTTTTTTATSTTRSTTTTTSLTTTSTTTPKGQCFDNEYFNQEVQYCVSCGPRCSSNETELAPCSSNGGPRVCAWYHFECPGPNGCGPHAECVESRRWEVNIHRRVVDDPICESHGLAAPECPVCAQMAMSASTADSDTAALAWTAGITVGIFMGCLIGLLFAYLAMRRVLKRRAHEANEHRSEDWSSLFDGVVVNGPGDPNAVVIGMPTNIDPGSVEPAKTGRNGGDNSSTGLSATALGTTVAGLAGRPSEVVGRPVGGGTGSSWPGAAAAGVAFPDRERSNSLSNAFPLFPTSADSPGAPEVDIDFSPLLGGDISPPPGGSQDWESALPPCGGQESESAASDLRGGLSASEEQDVAERQSFLHSSSSPAPPMVGRPTSARASTSWPGDAGAALPHHGRSAARGSALPSIPAGGAPAATDGPEASHAAEESESANEILQGGCSASEEQDVAERQSFLHSSSSPRPPMVGRPTSSRASTSWPGDASAALPQHGRSTARGSALPSIPAGGAPAATDGPEASQAAEESESANEILQGGCSASQEQDVADRQSLWHSPSGPIPPVVGPLTSVGASTRPGDSGVDHSQHGRSTERGSALPSIPAGSVSACTDGPAVSQVAQEEDVAERQSSMLSSSSSAPPVVSRPTKIETGISWPGDTVAAPPQQGRSTARSSTILSIPPPPVGVPASAAGDAASQVDLNTVPEESSSVLLIGGNQEQDETGRQSFLHSRGAPATAISSLADTGIGVSQPEGSGSLLAGQGSRASEHELGLASILAPQRDLSASLADDAHALSAARAALYNSAAGALASEDAHGEAEADRNAVLLENTSVPIGSQETNSAGDERGGLPAPEEQGETESLIDQSLLGDLID